MINYIELQDETNAIYINFPFCKVPCTYCHYVANLNFGFTSIPEEYVLMIIKQLDCVLKVLKGKQLESIYFGGGTPSLLTDCQIRKIRDVFEAHQIKSKEISIEIHPGMCNFDYVRNNFFTRYSFGVQSFDKNIRDAFNRKAYTIEDVKNAVKNIREKGFGQIINIDLLFDFELKEIDYQCINQLKPETVTLYPNTKGRGKTRLERVLNTLILAKSKLTEYIPLGKSKFIFIQNGCSQSSYAKNEYELNGNIIGIGQNSISYIGNKTYLCRYSGDCPEIVERIHFGSRYLNSLLMGITTGVLISYVKLCMPEIINMHFLRVVCSDKDISDKHTCLDESDLVYLPEDEYIRFYEFLLEFYGEMYAERFLSTIGFGDVDYSVNEYCYNQKLALSDEERISLMAKLYNKKMPSTKLKLPQLVILVEGIDGSGKDTFADLFVRELKKRFRYDSECRLSVMGQPDSSLAYGLEAKEFIENLEHISDVDYVQQILFANRLESEKKILKNKGITILIRGLVTDKATFKFVFDEDRNLGEGEIILRWDKYIVVSVKPEIADMRIESRGLKRTWREYLEYLRYFDDYYKRYTNSIFEEKIIIENTDLIKLREIAQGLADDIYAKEFNRRKKVCNSYD